MAELVQHAKQRTLTESRKMQQERLTEHLEATAALREEVPTGRADTILTWVGSDPDRAQRALDAENERTNPRSGLVDRLEQLAGSIQS